MTIPPVLDDLLSACQLPGCPVCRLVRHTVETYLKSLFYEKVNDIPVRLQLRMSLGFCQRHAGVVLKVKKGETAFLSDPLGVSIIYHDILGNLLYAKPLPGEVPQDFPKTERIWRFWRRFAARFQSRAQRVLSAMTARGGCPACFQEELASQNVLQVLAPALEKEDLRQALRSSTGLCLPHLKAALRQANTSSQVSILLELAQGWMSQLHQELAEFIRKNDYRFSGEPFGPESDAWRRAVKWVVGEGSGVGEDS